MENSKIRDEFNTLVRTLTNRGVEFTTEVNPYGIMNNFEESLSKEYKKKNGVVYTPSYVARAMCKIAIDDYLSGIYQDFISIAETTDTYLLRSIHKSLDEIKICDPCVGSGVYATEVIKLIIEYKTLLVKKLEGRALESRELAEETYQIIQNNLYCVDLDYNAVMVCKFRLWCLVEDLVDYSDFKCNIWNGNSLDNRHKGEPIFCGTNPRWEDGGIDWNLKEYDSEYYERLNSAYKKWITTGNTRDLVDVIDLSVNLKPNIGAGGKQIAIRKNSIQSEGIFDFRLMTGSVFEKYGGFDIVIGNPPYVRNTENKEYYRDKYVVGNTSGDLYIYFFELGYSLINDNGVLSLITPNKFFSANYAVSLRKYLIGKMYKVLDFDNHFVFENAWVPTTITMLNKKKNEDIKYCNIQQRLVDSSEKYLYKALINSKCIEIQTDSLDESKFVFEDINILELRKSLSAMTKLCELYNISKGIAIPLDKRIDREFEYPLLKGEDLQPYNEDTIYKIGVQEETRSKYYREEYNQYVAVREISKHIECSMVRGVIPLDSITVVQAKDYWVVGFLNSDIVDWIYNTLYCKNFMVGYAKVRFPRKTAAIGDIPVPDEIEQITPFVMDIIAGNEIEDNKTKINSIIKHLYGIEELDI